MPRGGCDPDVSGTGCELRSCVCPASAPWYSPPHLLCERKLVGVGDRFSAPQICHSKSREINPVKVAQLVKAYVDKYRHMRKYRRPEAGDEPPPATGAQG